MAPKRNSRKTKANPHIKNRNQSPASSSNVSDDDFEQAPAKQKKIELPKRAASSKSHECKNENISTESKGIVCPQSSLCEEFSKPEVDTCEKQSIVSYISRHQSGQTISRKYDKILKTTVMQSIKKLAVFKGIAPFDRRITSLAWNPRLITTLAVGSKGGDIILWNHQKETHDVFIQGSGPGGSIQAMKFDAFEESHLYTCSIDGTFCKRDLKSKNTLSVFLDTGEHRFSNWFTAFDVSFSGGLLLAGDNKGYVNLLTKEGTPVWKKRLHKLKIHSIEFHTREPWLVVTASLDNYVRLWDVRMMDSSSGALAELQHEKGVNSANFSLARGSKLLTTDLHSELRIFSGPLWNLETQILHPHRHFQHITPIKAHWHPLEDIVVIGRYPDPKMLGYESSEPRSVDFFDASDGKLLYQLESVGHKGIMSINRFDQVGNVLASAMGQNILLWKPKYWETNIPSFTDGQVLKTKMRRPLSADDDLKKKIKSSRVK